MSANDLITDTDAEPEATQQPAAIPGMLTEIVELDTPLTRGGQAVHKVTVRKPLSGALRGVALVDLLNMDTQSLQKVLPRITEPALSEADIRGMDPADLVQLGSKVSGFLLGKRVQDDQE